jgi:hypothetical protein
MNRCCVAAGARQRTSLQPSPLKSRCRRSRRKWGRLRHPRLKGPRAIHQRDCRRASAGCRGLSSTAAKSDDRVARSKRRCWFCVCPLEGHPAKTMQTSFQRDAPTIIRAGPSYRQCETALRRCAVSAVISAGNCGLTIQFAAAGVIMYRRGSARPRTGPFRTERLGQRPVRPPSVWV